jgi:hypothetical protein
VRGRCDRKMGVGKEGVTGTSMRYTIVEEMIQDTWVVCLAYCVCERVCVSG